MTEGYGPGHGDEGGRRPSGRGAVTERLAGHERGDAHEIDLTDETARESSGAFEPAGATRPGSSSIFDVDERARQEDLNRTGYEPPMADPDADPDGPRGETIVTEPGEAREEPGRELSAGGSAVGAARAGSKASEDSRSAWSCSGWAAGPATVSSPASPWVASSVRSISWASWSRLASRSVTAPRPEGRWPPSSP